MPPAAPPSPVRPCFLQARLLEGHLIEPVTITRVGAYRAQLSGRCPVAEGEFTVLEMDRPTDGERVKVGVRVIRIHTEGAQWGWKPAIHVEFLDPLTDLAPVELQAIDDPLEALRSSLDARGGDPVHVLSLSVSYDDTAEEIPAVADSAPAARLDREQVQGLALGVTGLEGARAVPALMRQRGALPAMYGMPLGRRDGSSTPWQEPPIVEAPRPAREPRVMTNSPVAYLTSGRHRAGMVQDFSRGGMFMAVHLGEPLPPVGASIRVEFAVPQGASVFLVGLTAEVRWLHEGERPSEPGRGAGLAITGFDRARGRVVYEEYVESLVGGSAEGG